ncbi:Virulence factor membrane-bound polymerase, C-terminal [Comamonadaceae bacterium]
MKHNKFIFGTSAVLLCMAWLQPLFLPPWVAFHGEVLAYAALATIFLAVPILSNTTNKLVVSFPEVSLLLLLVLIICQYAVGKIAFLGDVAVYTLYLIGLALAIAVGRESSSETNVLEYLAWCIALAALVSVFIALLQTFSIDEQYSFIAPASTWRRPGANLAQPNNLATLFLWGQASILYLYLAKKLNETIALVLMGLMAVGIAITESRTAFIGMLVLSVWMYMAPAQFGTKSRLVFISLHLGSLVTLFLLWPKLMWAYHEGAWAIDGEDARILYSQAGARQVVWTQLIAAAGMQPLFGWGFGGVSRALNAVIDQYELSYPFTYAHNILVDLLIGVGYPVACVFAIGWLIWFARRLSWKPEAGRWLSLAMLIPFVVHCLTEFPFSYAYFLFPVGIAIGTLDASRSGKLSFRVPRFVLFGVYFFWCLVALLVFRDYVLAEEDFRIARMEARKIGSTSVDYSRPKILVLDQLDAINTVTRITPTPGLSLEDIDLLKKAALRYPWTALQSRYALALALNGDIAEAKRQMLVIRAMHGSEAYTRIIENWKSKAAEKYPQLDAIISILNSI